MSQLHIQMWASLSIDWTCVSVHVIASVCVFAYMYVMHDYPEDRWMGGCEIFYTFCTLTNQTLKNKSNIAIWDFVLKPIMII